MDFIKQYWIFALGFFAQSIFGARQIVQLFLSEKQGKVVSPSIFWQLSLIASFLFLIYGIIRNDMVIIIGQIFSYCIYIRNLQLKNSWRNIPLIVRAFIILLPISILSLILFNDSGQRLSQLFSKTDFTHPLMIIGTIGQFMLNLRYLYQWYFSEKENESILPMGFWVISLVASAMIILYATLYRMEPVLLVSQSLGMLVYIRNIMLHMKHRARDAREL